jgi:Tol biopolymer transport system component
MRSGLSLIVLAAAVAVLGSAPLAGAGDGPANGRITFGRFDPALGDFSIWAANPDGTHQRRLTHVPSFFSDWSPSGSRIAFDFADDAGEHLATMDSNGRHVRQLTFGKGIQEIPRWSPDGRTITFDASPTLPDQPGFHTDIWAIRRDGTGARQLSRGGFDIEPVYSPDGRQIAYWHKHDRRSHPAMTRRPDEPDRQGSCQLPPLAGLAGTVPLHDPVILIVMREPPAGPGAGTRGTVLPLSLAACACSVIARLRSTVPAGL